MTLFNSVLNSLATNVPNIIIIIAIIIGCVKSYKSYLSLSKEQQIEAALKVIKTELLNLMSKAEIEWSVYKKSGELKKSQVLLEIYEQFPFLSTYIDQDTLIKRIEDMIDNEMLKMNKIINSDNSEELEINNNELDKTE